MIRKVCKTLLLNRVPIPLFSFSTKQQKRLQEKKTEEHHVKTMQHLDSVVDQHEFTDEQLEEILKKRKEEIIEMSKVNKIPSGALITFAAAIAPLITLTGAAYGFCYYDAYLSYAPLIYLASIKYAALTLSFSSGLHWGLALTLHECQKDSLNSSSEARWHFLLATAPILAAIFIINNISNVQEYTIDTTLFPLSVLIGLNICLDMLSANKNIIPQWLLKLKVPYSFIYSIAVGGLLMLPYIYKDKIQHKESIYRQNVQNQAELLQ